MESEIVLAIVGILATCVGGLIWVIKFMFSRILPVLEKLDDSNKKLTKATEKNTSATTKADEYLRQRNGRDIEFQKEMLKTIQGIVGN